MGLPEQRHSLSFLYRALGTLGVRKRRREGERERERERERRKWRHHCRAKIGYEFTLSLAKNSHIWRRVCTFPCQKFAPFVSPFTRSALPTLFVRYARWEREREREREREKERDRKTERQRGREKVSKFQVCNSRRFWDIWERAQSAPPPSPSPPLHLMVTMRGWADVGMWVAVCFLAKTSLHRATCKTAFARFTQSGNLAVISRFHHWEIRLFFHFGNFFYKKIPFPLPWWSKVLLVENLQVAGGQLRNSPV